VDEEGYINKHSLYILSIYEYNITHFQYYLSVLHGLFKLICGKMKNTGRWTILYDKLR
jgi:hypothetical protein